MRIAMRAVAVWCLSAGQADAHYHMLLTDKNSVKTGEEVVITYQFGHPYEHQLFDTLPPASAAIYRPDGTLLDVKMNLKKVEVASEKDKKVTAYELTFTPEQRGDHIVVFTSPEVAIEGEKLPIVDTAKVVVHVQTQNGWERRSAHNNNQAVDLTPLTRPYGLRAGMIFRAVFVEVHGERRGQNSEAPRPIRGAAVEVEHFNPQPPKQLPPDEHTTYTARTDDNGIMASTLPDPGWWAVTAIRPTDKRIDRCTFWIYVDDKIPLKPAE
jgi:uncharacterized GH25 family protein